MNSLILFFTPFFCYGHLSENEIITNFQNSLFSYDEAVAPLPFTSIGVLCDTVPEAIENKKLFEKEEDYRKGLPAPDPNFFK